MDRMHSLILLAFLYLFFPSASYAAPTVIHVPADVSTIQGAISIATSGDTILVAPGTYYERLDFDGKTISLVSEAGPELTIIDAQASGNVILMESGEGLGTLLEGFTITHGSGSFGAGIYLLGTSPTIRKNIFRENNQTGGGFGAAIACFGASPTIESNEFAFNACDNQYPAGVITLVNGSSPKIYNNILHDNDCRAINVQLPEGPTPRIFNNTIVRNRVGILVSNQVPTTTHAYRNNVIVDNNIGLEVQDNTGVFGAIWANNLLYANAVQYLGTTTPTGANGNSDLDPLFMDSAIGNFTLMFGSPAIDTGTAAGLVLPPVDFNGSPRVQDGDGNGIAVVDRGALEASFPDSIFASGFEALVQ